MAQKPKKKKKDDEREISDEYEEYGKFDVK